MNETTILDLTVNKGLLILLQTCRLLCIQI